MGLIVPPRDELIDTATANGVICDIAVQSNGTERTRRPLDRSTYLSINQTGAIKPGERSKGGVVESSINDSTRR